MSSKKNDSKKNDEPRMDRVEDAKWKIKHGFYDQPGIFEEAFERLLRAVRNAE